MSHDELIENLKKLSGEHEKHLSDIREKIRVLDSVPKAKALVGKCFKYRSGGAFLFGGRAKGWTFQHIVSTNGDNVLVNSFSVEAGKIEFSFGTSSYVNHFSHAAMVQITEKAYNREFNKMIKALILLNKRGTYGK